MPSTVIPNSRLKSIETLSFLRYGRCPEISNLIVMVVARSLVFTCLECKKGGNVILRHNEIRDELADLASKAIVPSAVRNEPLITRQLPPVKTSELDQDQPAVSRNLHKNRGETEEMLVSVVFGTAVLIASLMSVSLIPTPRAISSPPSLGNSRKGEKKKYLGLASSVVLSLRSWSPPMASSARKRRPC
jgi:hypothetical protein